ncbi:MAG: MFS transporter [Acetobacteraceae bacterium]|nr:MFS transporter [Acetobacteraceae bacterium]
MTRPDPADWSALWRPPHLAPVAMLSLGIGLYAFNTFLVAAALPSAVLEIGGAALYAWASTLFLVSAIVGGAGGAALKARLGARGGLLLGGAAFLAGTLACGLAPAMPVLLLGRALQGAGEGVVAAISYALIPALFPQRLVVRVFAVEAVVWALAGFAGPVVGGLLTQAVSWRAAFLVNAPVALVFLALVLAVVKPALAGGVAVPAPLLRLAALGGGILLVASSSLAGNVLAAAGLVTAGGAALALVVVLDRRRADSLLPRDAFRPGVALGAGLLVVLLMPVAHSFVLVHLTFALQQGWGFSPTAAGAMFALGPMAWSGAMLVVANIRHPGMAAFGIRYGPVLLGIGIAGQLAAVLAGAPWAMLPFLAATGAAFGIGWAFLSVAVMQAAGPGERDRAAGLVPTAQSAGYAIGAALAGLAASAAGLDGSTATGTARGYAVVVACGLAPAALAIWVALRRREWPGAGRAD